MTSRVTYQRWDQNLQTNAEQKPSPGPDYDVHFALLLLAPHFSMRTTLFGHATLPLWATVARALGGQLGRQFEASKRRFVGFVSSFCTLRRPNSIMDDSKFNFSRGGSQSLRLDIYAIKFGKVDTKSGQLVRSGLRKNHLASSPAFLDDRQLY